MEKIKCIEIATTNKIKIIFPWPPGVGEAYITADNIPQGLYTLDEYRIHGGYITQKTPGKTTYTITIGDTVQFITFTEPTVVECQIKETVRNGFKIFKVTLTPSYPLAKNTIGYTVGNVNYYFQDPIETSLTRIIQLPAHENIKLFSSCGHIIIKGGGKYGAV